METCIICLDSIENSVKTDCCKKVLYHDSCGKKWFDTNFLNPQCPWCKQSINNENNIAIRSYNMLKNLVSTINYQSTFNFYSVLNELNMEDYKDKENYFELFYFKSETMHEFKIIFKDNSIFVFWYDKNSQTNIFPFSCFQNLIKNKDQALQKYKANELIAYAYFE
jgi:hypothetical protein